MHPHDKETSKTKSEARSNINLWLLSICFTLFTFIVAVNPKLLQENPFLSLQLTLAIPLLMTSIFARTKLAHTHRIRLWEEYGFITFIIAYGFLLNVVGILLAMLVNTQIGIIFFVANIFSALVYSGVEVIEQRSKLMSRIYKDLFFIFILFFLGILPIL